MKHDRRGKLPPAIADQAAPYRHDVTAKIKPPGAGAGRYLGP
jgi:hypothetical protein